MGLEGNKVELSVIMPVYNEEDIIANSIIRTLDALESANFKYELIIVDDGSEDGTARILENFKNRAVILSYKDNRGKGYALRYGSINAQGNFVAFFDSDLNIDPVQLIYYLMNMKAKNIDVLVGSKRLRESIVRSSIERQFLSIVYHLFVKALLGLEVMDTQVGIKFFRRNVLDDVIPILTIDRFAFDVELLVLTSRFGYRIAELPVSINMETGISRVSLRTIEKMFVDTFKILYKLKIARDSKYRYQIPESSARRNAQ